MLGAAALILAVAAVVVAWRSAMARLWLGIVLAVLFAGLVWQDVGNEGFRFVWHQSEGELLLFEFVLGLTAIVLIATGVQPPQGTEAGPEEDAEPRPGRWLVRAAVYLCGAAALMHIAYQAGMSSYAATECADDSGACDFAGLSGMVWALISLPVSVVLIVVIELVLRRRRKERRTSADLSG